MKATTRWWQDIKMRILLAILVFVVLILFFNFLHPYGPTSFSSKIGERKYGWKILGKVKIVNGRITNFSLPN